MRTYMRGRLSLVQEERFQLVDDRGVAHLFLVAPDVSLKPADLRDILRSGQPVRVEYEEAPTLIAHIAKAIHAEPALEEPSQ
jgi:hypothetical protein